MLEGSAVYRSHPAASSIAALTTIYRYALDNAHHLQETARANIPAFVIACCLFLLSLFYFIIVLCVPPCKEPRLVPSCNRLSKLSKVFNHLF
jgi:hypothetical protein